MLTSWCLWHPDSAPPSQIWQPHPFCQQLVQLGLLEEPVPLEVCDWFTTWILPLTNSLHLQGRGCSEIRTQILSPCLWAWADNGIFEYLVRFWWSISSTPVLLPSLPEEVAWQIQRRLGWTAKHQLTNWGRRTGGALATKFRTLSWWMVFCFQQGFRRIHAGKKPEICMWP